jgi:hypothetical protein
VCILVAGRSQRRGMHCGLPSGQEADRRQVFRVSNVQIFVIAHALIRQNEAVECDDLPPGKSE